MSFYLLTQVVCWHLASSSSPSESLRGPSSPDKKWPCAGQAVPTRTAAELENEFLMPGLDTCVFVPLWKYSFIIAPTTHPPLVDRPTQWPLPPQKASWVRFVLLQNINIIYNVYVHIVGGKAKKGRKRKSRENVPPTPIYKNFLIWRLGNGRFIPPTHPVWKCPPKFVD